MSLNLTAVTPVKPEPVIVTTVPLGPDEGEKEAMLALQLEVTLPYNVKSSSLKVPLEGAPVSAIVMFTVPVRPDIGLLTGVMPRAVPGLGTEPVPTVVPFTAIVQVVGPDALRCLQKSKSVIAN